MSASMVQLTEVSPPAEAIRHQQANTRADVGGQDLGNGVLFIAESCVTWQRENDSLGLNIQYPDISCHAVSRDLHFFPHECLHLMVEQPADDSREEGDGPTVMDIRFIPLDKTVLQTMYKAMAQCQALHPDPIDEIIEEGQLDDMEEEDEEEEEEFYYDDEVEEGAAHLSSAGRAQLARLDAMLQSGGGGDACSGVNGAAASGESSADQFQDADME